MSAHKDIERALDHIIQMQSWVASWHERDEELIKNLYQVRVRLERQLVRSIVIR